MVNNNRAKITISPEYFTLGPIFLCFFRLFVFGIRIFPIFAARFGAISCKGNAS